MQGYQLPGVYSASLQCNVAEQGPSNAVGCPSVRLSRLSSAAIRRAAAWFASELGRGQQISIDSCGRLVPAVDRYLLQAPAPSSKCG